MMPEQSTQHGDAVAQNDPRIVNVPRRTFDVDNPPALVGADTLAVIWGVSLSQIYRRIQHGDFDRFKTSPAIGPKCFSGILLARFLKGEPLYMPSFGRKRA